MELSDKELLNGIAQDNREMIRNVYRAFYPAVESIVFSLHGTREDARDIFQESLLVIYSKMLNNDFILTSSLKTYLCSVAKNMRYVAMRREGRTIRITQENNSEVNEKLLEETSLSEEKEDKQRLYEKHFNLINIECQKLLKYFLSDLPLKKITYLMHFKNDAYTNHRRHKCKEYLMNSITVLVCNCYLLGFMVPFYVAC